MKARVAVLAVAGLMLWFAGHGGAYSTNGRRWASGSSIVMRLGQASSSGALIDGSADWNAVTEAALSTWNANLNGVSFRVTRDSSGGSLRNGINDVIWADDMYGDAFGDAIAVTISLSRSNTNTEADVLFDRARNWNAYRGNLRGASGGGTLFDMRRVALHEFGHVLGLDHPDQNGQSVSAIMNSRVSNVDSLQADDINGVRAIYGSPAAPARPSDTLTPGTRLLPGQSLTSANGRYRLLYQTDGNLVLYDDVDRTAPWTSNTAGTTAGQVVMQSDGNFVVYDSKVAGLWSSDTAGNANARLLLQPDGNLVVYRADGLALWGSRQAP